MTKEILHKKVSRYLHGQSKPAEKRQIQSWLSCTDDKKQISEDEKSVIENEILAIVQAQTAYPLFFPKPGPWWKKITAFF
jgi:hypothetical protein